MGELEGPHPGKGKRIIPDAELSPKERHLARLLTEHRAEVERVIAEHAPKGEATPHRTLQAIRRALANTAEGDARVVTPGTNRWWEGDGWRVFSGRFQEALVPSASVDLIVTDPPYPAESLPLWEDLGRWAARVLKPSAILVALTGQILLPEVLARLGASGLAYGWTYAQVMDGASSRVLARHIGQEWKPWVAYVNGTWPSGRIDWHPDRLISTDYNPRGWRWEQSATPAARLIDTLAPAGGLVVDPMCGVGTYGRAALGIGRQFVGIEADAGRAEKSAERLGGAA
jgi:DNA methylase